MAVVEINDQSFEQEVETVKKGIVLVDFWAPWCRPCKQLAPILEELDQNIGEHVKIVKINVEANPEVAARLNVSSLPSLLAFTNGKQVAKLTGIQSKEKLLKWLKIIHKRHVPIESRRKINK